MITIKLPYTTSQENLDLIKELQKQQSLVFRWSYNRLKENLKEKQIRLLSKNLNNIDNIDSWFIQCAIKEAIQQIESEKQLKIEKSIFGGKKIFFDRLQRKISKEDWKNSRLRPLISQGEKLRKGNRKFKFEIIEQNKILFKPSRNIKIYLSLPKLRKQYKNQLFVLQQLAEQKQIAFTIKLDRNFIYISFEEIIEKQNQKIKENYIGIDLNPNYIACSLFDKNKNIKQSWTFNLSKVTKKFNQNKILFETFEISKKISELCNIHNVKYVFIEDLNIRTTNHNKGKYFNKLVNNSWPRSQFVLNLKKRLNVCEIKLFSVNSAYSSTIGNLMHTYPDPISASCEIARRGYECIIQKLKKFYPKLDINSVTCQWKDILQNNNFTSWKEFHEFIKNSKLKYRISWSDDYVFRNFYSKKSCVSYNYTTYVI